HSRSRVGPDTSVCSVRSAPGRPRVVRAGATPHDTVAAAISYCFDDSEGGEVRLVRTRPVAVSMFVAGLVVGNGGFVAQADNHTDPPALDVDTVLTKLADQQIYRAPGAVASFDKELVREELPEDVRLLVGPYKHPD